jgi:hypothetical protein
MKKNGGKKSRGTIPLKYIISIKITTYGGTEIQEKQRILKDLRRTVDTSVCLNDTKY